MANNINSDYRPRLAAELTPESHQRLTQILPHGMQKPLFQVIVNGILEVYDKGGMPALGAIISNHLLLERLVDIGLGRTKKEQIEILEKKLIELRGRKEVL